MKSRRLSLSERVGRIPRLTRRRFLGASLLTGAALWPGSRAARELSESGPSGDGAPSLLLERGGARVGFDESGGMVLFSRRGEGIPLPAAAGVSVRDPLTGSAYRVQGRARREGDRVRVRADLGEAGLEAEVSYRLLPDGALEVGGFVRDRTVRDRVVDVAFSLPIGLGGWAWERSIAGQVRLLSGGTRHAEAQLPLAAVSAPGGRYGVALSVPPTHPARFEIGADPVAGSFSVRLAYGLSPSAGRELRSRAPFRFVVDVLPGGWGFREALARLYARYPEIFRARARRYGFWRLAPADALPASGPYAVRETGLGVGDARTVAEYARNDGWEADEGRGVLTLAYTLVGQGEITDLPRLPENPEEAVRLLGAWRGAPHPFGGPSPERPNSYESAEEHRAIIRRSGLHGRRSRLRALPRATIWGGNSVTFPLNPNPALPRGAAGEETIASYALGRLVPRLLSSPLVDGIYADSLHAWGNVYNYRREHFRWARIPLTYDPRWKAPALWNGFSHVEVPVGVGAAAARAG